MDKFNKDEEEGMSKLMSVMATTIIANIADTLNDLPVDDDYKKGMMLTIEVSILNRTLNGLHQDMPDDQLLKKKLEFVRIIRETFIQEHNEMKKEQKNDNG
jgi:hypothetical protein